MTASSGSEYMLRALKLAEKGRCTVSPNPMVGCVMVNAGIIVGEGYHQRAGAPHAEIYAIQAAGSHAKGATVYVTLEPCSHFGRTPPCVDALIEAKVAKVVIACLDPNPLVAGRGVEALTKAGIHVEVGVCEAEAKKLNEIFFHYITTKRPFVILKWAMSLDGKTMTQQSDDRQISNMEAQQHMHQLRNQVDAILIGANTAILDDPRLTVRLGNDEEFIKHPLRVILSSGADFPLHLKVFDKALPGKTMVVTTTRASAASLAMLNAAGVETVILPSDDIGRVDLKALLEYLGQREMTSLFVEGGMTVHHAFMQSNLVNKLCIYLANVVIGELDRKHTLSEVKCERLIDNIYLEAKW